MKLRKILISLIAPGILCLALSACYKQAETAEFFAMDTFMRVTVCGKGADAALTEVQQYVNSLEQRLSVTRPGSEISLLNENGSAQVSAETASLIESALRLSDRCGGRFDITVSPAVDAWGFYTDEYRVPSESELEALRERIDYTRVRVDGSAVTLGEGQRIDLGGIAKGYASREICNILDKNGVRSALIVLGGSIQLVGAKPDGTAWRVGLQDPDGSDDYLGIWSGCECALVTSGDYQRCFEQDGTRYHHILNPDTAAPARSDLRSVTILGGDPVLGDAYSTALYVMGAEKACEFWRGDPAYDMILYTRDGRLLLTPGAADSFETSLPTEVIEP